MMPGDRGVSSFQLMLHCPRVDGIADMKIIAAIYESVKTGAIVKLA